jgi:chaperone BCS1
LLAFLACLACFVFVYLPCLPSSLYFFSSIILSKMSDKVVTVNSPFPAVLGLAQLLPVLVNPKSRKQVEKLLNFRNLIGILLSGIFWRLDATFDFRTRLRRIFEGRVVIKSTDDSYTWMMHYLSTHPNFLASQRDIEVTTKLPAPKAKGKSPSSTVICEKKGVYYNTLIRDMQTVQKLFSSKVDDKKRESEPDDVKYEKVMTTEQAKTSMKAGKDSVQVLLKPAPSATTYFIFQKTHFWATQEQSNKKDSKTQRGDGVIVLKYWSLTSGIVEQLIRQAHESYMADQEKTIEKVSMFRLNSQGVWKGPKYAKRRSFDTVHLPDSVKEAIRQDARTFFSPGGQRKYNNRTIPYRRGLLFYGPPGNGKSTLAHTLASDLGEPLYILDLGLASLDDEMFLYAMKDLPARCIVLIEDIDVALIKREGVPAAPSEGDNYHDDRKNGGKTKKKEKTGISYSCLLNTLDGLDASEGRLLVVTTNHFHRLDAALIRPGRIDRKFEILNAIPDQAHQLFVRWFTLKNKFSTDQVRKHADIFAKAIPTYKCSVASLQGYLLGYDEDSERAAQDVEAWVKEELKGE